MSAKLTQRDKSHKMGYLKLLSSTLIHKSNYKSNYSKGGGRRTLNRQVVSNWYN